MHLKFFPPLGGRREQTARLHHIGERRVSAVLAAYPASAHVVCLCHDCGLEQSEAVGDLRQRLPVSGLTRQELAAILRCERFSCGAPVDVRIVASPRSEAGNGT